MVLKWNSHEKEFSQGYRKTTNNRMELLAVIIGLESLTRDSLEVDVYSDSKYVVEAVNQGWLFGWEKKAFRKKKNADLWKRFLQAYRKHRVKFHWVKGHNDHHYNVRCDLLATEAADSGDFLVDEIYEKEGQKADDLF